MQAKSDAELLQQSGDHSETQGPGGMRGRNAMNFGINGGVLFQDKECSISTGSFTLFAVVCLNDQTTPGCGQFTVLRGSHHAMEKFYQMQQPRRDRRTGGTRVATARFRRIPGCDQRMPLIFWCSHRAETTALRPTPPDAPG